MPLFVRCSASARRRCERNPALISRRPKTLERVGCFFSNCERDRSISTSWKNGIFGPTARCSKKEPQMIQPRLKPGLGNSDDRSPKFHTTYKPVARANLEAQVFRYRCRPEKLV